MGRSVAIAIGVGQSGDLVILRGARNGAHEFAAWAHAVGFDQVVELIDDGSRKVRASEIYQVIDDAVDVGDVERLFIFFAGHGVAKGTALDFWLLSEGARNPNEAVNVDASLRLARGSGIAHVAVFADACRTMAGKDRMGVEGFVIFPNVHVPRVSVEMDSFFGARPGYASLEVVPDAAAEAAFGVFTRCLMLALNAQVSGAAEPIPNGKVSLAITAQSLRRYLLSSVPEQTSLAAGSKVQEPDCRSESTFARNVYRWLGGAGDAELRIEPSPGDVGPTVRLMVCDGRTAEFGAHSEGAAPLTVRLPVGTYYFVEVTDPSQIQDPATRAIRRLLGDDVLVIGLLGPEEIVEGEPRPELPLTRVDIRVMDPSGAELGFAPGDGVFPVLTRDVLTGRSLLRYQALSQYETPVPSRDLKLDPSDADVVKRFAAMEGRGHFETGSGLTIVGAEVAFAVVRGGSADLFQDEYGWNVRGTTDYLGPLVVGLSDGRWIATALMPGFLGVAVVGKDGVDGFSFLPAPGHRWEEFGGDESPTSVREAVAFANAAANVGSLDVGGDPSSFVGGLLRSFVHPNPTLALFAAYASDREGKSGLLRELIGRLHGLDQPVPYDLVLLAGQAPDWSTVPSYPLLTQGWAYLDPEGIHPAVRAARRTLAPSLWATPQHEGGVELATAVERGEL